MMAEFGTAFKEEKGGIYSWMEKSVGPKFAFIATFMWYASYVVWMVNVASGIWVPISNGIFGSDTTNTWALFGIKWLTGPKTLGLLGAIFIIIVTYVSTKGLDKIKKVTNIGGSAVVLANLVLLLGALLVFIGNHGHLAEPIVGLKTFIINPGPASSGGIVNAFAFIVFALFAYGGIEVLGGLVDQTENAEKTFPKGIVIAAIVISIGYSLGIFLCGVFTKWSALGNNPNVTLGNISYVIMANLGYAIAKAFGGSTALAMSMSHGFARVFGITMFLCLVGAFFTLMYAPLKVLIYGTPTKLWPGKMGVIDEKSGFPLNAMWIQAVIVCVMILFVAFGGNDMQQFFIILVSMTNVAMTLPYMMIAYAFIPFKKNTDIIKPFTVYKSYTSSVIWTIIVMFTVGFANFFSILQPALQGSMSTTIWTLVGPVFFSLVAWLMYRSYEKKYVNKK